MNQSKSKLTLLSDGTREWRHPVSGKLHRLNGPAIESTDTLEWHVHGKLHRDDGPAIITKDFEEWYKEGELHRELGPAKIDYETGFSYFQHGKLHRKDGPAVVKTNGSFCWYINGQLHRDGGLPAVCFTEREDSYIFQFFENGVYIRQEAVSKQSSQPKLINDLHKKLPNIDEPAQIVSDRLSGNTPKFEVTDVILSWGLDFCLGTVVKHIARAQHTKKKLEDLTEAQWYLNRAISELTRKLPSGRIKQ